MEEQYLDDILRAETKERLLKNYFSDRDLSVKCIENGYILPYRGQLNGVYTGGCLSSEHAYIENSGLHEKLCCGYSFNESDVINYKKTAIYIGMFLPVWGHCLTDNLKKLWFFKTEMFSKLRDTEYDIVYLVMQDEPSIFPEGFKLILQLFEVDLNRIKLVKDISRYSKIYIPNDSTYEIDGQIHYTSTHIALRNFILDSLDKKCLKIKTYKKVYFSRSKMKDLKDYGEKRIEDVFKYLGYKIIYPETLSFWEQYVLLRNCDCFAATEGSVSHNSFFCKKGTQVCILRKGAYLNKYQFMINQLCNLRVTYVDVHLSLLVDSEIPWYGPFFVYVNQNLLSFAKLPSIFNNFTMASYKSYMRQYGRKKSSIKINDYYGKRLLDELNMAFFCKNFFKRLLHIHLSRCNLSIWVPIYNMFIKR